MFHRDVRSSQDVGRDGRLHSAQFIDLSGQPVEVAMLLSPAKYNTFFERLDIKRANIFYVETPIGSSVLAATGP